LLALGVSSAWISSLTTLEPFRPIFIGLTTVGILDRYGPSACPDRCTWFAPLLFLGLASYRLYLVRPACAPESACADPRTNSANAYPQLIDALKLLSAKSAIIDGEITVLDADERTSFQLLQFYGSGKRTQFVDHAFDVLFIAN
jgi:hypothetical protein